MDNGLRSPGPLRCSGDPVVRLGSVREEAAPVALESAAKAVGTVMAAVAVDATADASRHGGQDTRQTRADAREGSQVAREERESRCDLRKLA